MSPSEDKAQSARNYAIELARFNDSMRAAGVNDIDRYYWYHTIDLPALGLSTPGMYDFRASVQAFKFPADMTGLTVLDVGSATGFFGFEFERRGADVLCTELASLEDLDRFPGQETSTLLNEIQRMIVPHSAEELPSLVRKYSAQELHYYLLDGPFRLCSRFLKSGVRRSFCTVYELSAGRLGQPGFDLVFLGDILLHTLRPFDALVAAAKVCRGTLIAAQILPGKPEDPPAMSYVGGDDISRDDISWWLPNEQCIKQILLKLGFARVERIGTHEGILRPAGHPYTRGIIRADRACTALPAVC